MGMGVGTGTIWICRYSKKNFKKIKINRVRVWVWLGIVAKNINFLIWNNAKIN